VKGKRSGKNGRVTINGNKIKGSEWIVWKEQRSWTGRALGNSSEIRQHSS
jgi:hypothetical protein